MVVAGKHVERFAPVKVWQGSPVPVEEKRAGFQLHQKGTMVQERDAHGKPSSLSELIQLGF